MGYKRDYLNSTETMEIAFINELSNTLGKLIEDWSKTGMLSSEKESNLQVAKKYIDDFICEVALSLDQKEKVKLAKKIKNNPVLMFDMHKIKKFEKRKEDSLYNFAIDYDDFCKFAEEIMNVRCKDCNVSWKDCDLYPLLDKNNAPESGFCVGQCKYAYILPKKKDDKQDVQNRR